MKKTNRKNSGARKLLPAFAMLTVSAISLSSATYAWFTMSREVEVTNIKMTATVPEDIQISLGTLTNGALNENSGMLTASSGSADNGNVKAPSATTDWSNLADISHYYQFGKMIPASSTDGESIFFTPDANGVGKTVATDAKYYTAAEKSDAGTEDRTSATTKYNTTVHAVTGDEDKWFTTNYKTATAWNTTNDDGYYVDIPVWLRTSSEKGASLSVQAYVKPKNSGTKETEDTEKDALYRAVRVAILDDTGAAKTKLIPVADGWDIDNKKIKDNPFDLGTNNANSIIDYFTRATDKEAVKSVVGNAATYDKAEIYEGNGIIDLAAGGSGQYGTETKIIVRVWLEGEDKDCWNATAGQDWSINLKFNNETTNAGGATKSDIAGVNTSVAVETPVEATTAANNGD